MAEQEDQFYLEPQEQQVRQIKAIEQPIPLFDKPKIQEPKNISLKMVDIPKREQTYHYVPFKMNDNQNQQKSDNQDNSVQYGYDSPFTEFYNIQQCTYQRFQNQACNKMSNVTYFAGCFIHKNVFHDNTKQQVKEISEFLKDYYQSSNLPLPTPKENQLQFSSNFESGNLFTAFKVGNQQYDLVMQNDTNSRGNNQWFYFKVQKMVAGLQYTFNVVNFTKNDSLFNYGMLPTIYSKIAAEKYGIQWHRAGKDVTYKRGSIPRQNSRRYYYKLSFKLTNKYANDVIQVAHSYPYTYTMLKQYIQTKINKNKDIITKFIIGKTLAKYNLQVLQITVPINKKRDNRKAIVIMARQHPGETQGSFVCEGVIDKLLSKTRQGQFLRKNYVIYVIPMVNIDGVIFGHYRTNLSGNDLNRKWDSTQKQFNCPQVVSIKLFLQQVSKQRDIRFILDLHGHSKKLNSFFYGNPFPQNPQVVRIYPYVCGKMNPAIQFLDCTFASEQYKRKAARVYLSYYYRLIHVYTFQSSFYGYFKDGKKYQFNIKQYKELGNTLIQCLFMQLQHQIKFQQSFEFNLSKSPSKDYNGSSFVKFLTQLKSNITLLQTGNKCQSGSQSKPQQCEINNNDIPLVKPIVRQLLTPQITQQSINKSTNKISRKGTRQIKQIKQIIAKPTRNLKVLEISRVNSVLPDKYQLGLQPIKKKQHSQVLARNNSGILRINTQAQTDIFQIMSPKDYKITQIQENQLADSLRAQTPSSKDKRYSSVVKTQNRNNIIFKIDLLSRDSRAVTLRQKKILKHAFSQTIISYQIEKAQRGRSSQLFPSVDNSQRQLSDPKWLKCTSIKYDTMRIGMKRQAEMFLNGMVKKYFAQKQLKLKDHALSKCPEIPMSIMKKQIYNIKK